MYKSYKAYVGNFPDKNRLSITDVLAGISERDEYIVSVTPVGEANISVLIITQEPEQLELSVLEAPEVDTNKIADEVMRIIDSKEVRHGRS